MIVDEEQTHGERQRRVDIIEAQHCCLRVQVACAATNTSCLFAQNWNGHTMPACLVLLGEPQLTTTPFPT